MRWHTLLGLGAGLLVAGTSVTCLVGCSNASPTSTGRPAASTLSEGVNLLDASDAAWGFNAAYLKSGRVVYVESRLGQLKPDVYRQSFPDEPEHEMDLRFVDGNNRMFFAQRGGDSWIDPTWGPDVARSLDPATVKATPAEAEQAWADAHEAAAAIAKVLDASFKDHSYHLNTFATIPSPGSQPALTAMLSHPASGEQAYGTYSNGATWTQLTYEKFAKSVYGVGSHSGVGMYVNPAVGYWVFQINACNHGTCPNQSGWNDACWSPHGNTFSTVSNFNGETQTVSTGVYDGTGGCQTPYSWDSGTNGNPNNASHLCNDDAAYEMWQANNGSANNSLSFNMSTGSCCEGSCCGSWCGINSCPSRGSSSNYSCGTAGSDSGDWATPFCF